MSDALHFVNEAIEALSLEMYRGRNLDHMLREEGPQCSIAIELDRIETALGPRGATVLGPMAENIRQAVIALYAARDALKGFHP